MIRDGWYMTGDIAQIDEDGFIQITGRLSRFSKIGGEMVPHIKVEEALARLVNADDDEAFSVVVTSVNDERKGERIVVLHTKIDKSPEELRDGLAKAGLPNLYIPSTDSFREVPSLPVLGSGKLDLRSVKALAAKPVWSRDPELSPIRSAVTWPPMSQFLAIPLRQRREAFSGGIRPVATVARPWAWPVGDLALTNSCLLPSSVTPTDGMAIPRISANLGFLSVVWLCYPWGPKPIRQDIGAGIGRVKVRSSGGHVLANVATTVCHAMPPVMNNPG